MEEINDLPGAKIIKRKLLSIEIEVDSTKFSDFKGSGIVEDVKVDCTVSFKTYSESVNDPAGDSIMTIDYSNMRRAEELHVI